MITVELLVFPGRITSYSLDDHSTVDDLVRVARSENPGANFNGEIRINNSIVSGSRTLYGGERVVITKKVKGNQITVKIQKVPGRNVELSLNPGSSVNDAIAAADLGDTTGYQARLDGVEVERNATMPNHGGYYRIILTKKVKGN